MVKFKKAFKSESIMLASIYGEMPGFAGYLNAITINMSYSLLEHEDMSCCV